MAITTSLIISTYNWPEALSLVLKSVISQSIKPLEVVIADDGSGEATKKVIQDYKNKLSVPLKHVWHKDNGFKRSTILNKAISIASGEYIIQVDGDCILHKHFVKNHYQNALNNHYLYGSRVNIKSNYLSKLYTSQKTTFHFLSKGIKKKTRAIYIPLLNKAYKPHVNFSNKLRGCNFSFFKQDFIAVNGYNEDFKGWGKEDSELALRFHNFGLSAKRLRYAGIVFHIFHKNASKENITNNNTIENETIRLNKKWCPNGIDKYLNEIHSS